jgi:hypothetical protein
MTMESSGTGTTGSTRPSGGSNSTSGASRPAAKRATRARTTQARRPRKAVAPKTAAAKAVPKAEATPVTVRTKRTASSMQVDARTLAFAWIGIGDLVASKLQELSERFVEMTRDPIAMRQASESLSVETMKVIGDLAERGEKFVSGIQDSAYTRRAMGQTAIARSQVKAARTSILKAVDTATVAAREAVKKVS